MLGRRVLADDKALQVAIRHQLSESRRERGPLGPSTATLITSLKIKERKLLDLYYADKIDSNAFGNEARRLATQRATSQSEVDELERKNLEAERTIDQFDHVAALLAELNLESLWEEATVAE